MFNFDMSSISKKLMQNYFRPVPDAVWDIQTGKIGIASESGILTLSGTGQDAVVESNIIDTFGLPVPAYAQSTPVADLKTGDAIFVNDTLKGWIIEITEPTDGTEETRKFQVISKTGSVSAWRPPKVKILGFETGVMVLRSMMAMMPGGTGDLSSVHQTMMMMGMMGGNGGGNNDMMKFMMMQSLMGGTNSGTNPMAAMMPMLMMNSLGGQTSTQKGAIGSGKTFFDTGAK